jgi:hypothetical protein
MSLWTRALLVLLLGCGFSGPATACTTWIGYRVPTNFELVHQADLIVLGRIRAAPEGAPATEAPAVPREAASLTAGSAVETVLLEPVRVLKGKRPGRPLRLNGSTVRGARPSRGLGGTPVAPVFTSLNEVNPSAMAGACVRLNYPSGGLVLVLFEQTEQGMRMISAPFARAAEDVKSPDALWVRAAAAYVAMQRGVEPSRLREAAARHLRRLRSRAADPFAQAVSADLRAYLQATSGTK